MEELEKLSPEDRTAFKKHYNRIKRAFEKIIENKENKDSEIHAPKSAEHQ